ncbi:MAG: hypothetical protein ACFB0E_18315 [Leptolyngbyaceae cyanobacterium]
MVDLQAIVDDLYKQLGYDYFIDNSQAPPLPWRRKDLESLSR